MKQFKTIFNYKRYSEFMEAKKVRHGKDRTYTLYDFITLEQEKEIQEKSIRDLTNYNPTPEIVQKHFRFINNLSRELEVKYPNDTFLKSLKEEENQELKVSSDWFTKYDIEYPKEQLKELQNVKF
jgi:hypothetical protein